MLSVSQFATRHFLLNQKSGLKCDKYLYALAMTHNNLSKKIHNELEYNSSLADEMSKYYANNLQTILSPKLKIVCKHFYVTKYIINVFHTCMCIYRIPYSNRFICSIV